MVSASSRGLFIILTLAACGGAQRVPDAPPLAREPVELSLPSVDGAEVSFSRWRGKVVVVHFASTSSLDSQADVEEMRRTRTESRDLVLVEVVLDTLADKLAAPWADASRIDWSVLLPTPELRQGQTTFGAIRVLPTTFVIDPEGHLGLALGGWLAKGAPWLRGIEI